MAFLGLSLITWLLLVFAFLMLYIYSTTWKFSYWKKRGVPSPKPVPLLGNTLQVLKNGFHQQVDAWMKELGPIFGLYAFGTTLIVGDVDVLRQILIKDFDHFRNHRQLGVEVKPFSKGVVRLTDDHWKNVRNILTPTFSAGKLKKMVPLLNGACRALIKKLCTASEDKATINVKMLYNALMLDVVAATNFGLDVNSQENPDNAFFKYIEIMLRQGKKWLMIILTISPRLYKVFEYLGFRIMDQTAIDFFMDVTEKVIEARKADPNDKRVDFIRLMIDAHEMEPEKDEDGLVTQFNETGSDRTSKKVPMTSEEVMSQSITFIIAGYDTSSTLLSTVCYLLALNPEIQDKLIEEVDAITEGTENLEYDIISKMVYLDQIIQEALRMYPPAPTTDRLCSKTWTNGKLTIDKGTVVMIPIYSLHHNPDLWPEPEKFNPDRFTKEEKEKRHPMAWIPFGHGPRNCIGMRFALLVVKFALTSIFQKYKVVPVAETPVPLVSKDFGRILPNSGIPLGFEKREGIE
ncbi:cytochrome P450 3A24-like [Anneissia japonica]|uniref:cytochrome P450 3A24-like n=1 Tax=Anneissia japonica TaxID=1529436 RepID=UPI0014255E11|nr:cytochrome P450 3A24-like [Anneissia japonica]